ncbi:PAS domain-containing sensor histidine kinase [Phyllobacterium phragmitis]|uniref:histidine kinase n=1 Tax=Phyllobacterium phragmitis TaxID=2670329 RepID=A0A2S9IKX7_9HYPH|nr:histidine kinase dimerization/phospho-acceptor domain-containing protein [Phyllobacterium phragmitis]PRD41181.1 PAS domain-containing sensor histidine kinase [Phyllobacterium phragmitis]
MPGTYPFIDIAVLDDIRERFVRGDALVVISPDLKSVIWANGPGAAMFGFDRIDDVLGNDPGFAVHTKRQIMALDGSQAGNARTVSVRLASGLTSRLASFQIFDIDLPDGTPARVLAMAGTAGQHSDVETAITGLGDESTHVALLDEAGAVLARSVHFDELGILPTTLSDLVVEVRDEEDRMVKRRVRAGGRSVPAGIARLADDPYRHLLFVIAEREAAEAETVQVIDNSVPSATIADVVFADVEPPSPEIADIGDVMDEAEPATEEPVSAEEADEASEPALPPQAFTYDPSATPARFVWKVDADTVFSEISPEFAAAVGPQAAAVIGRRFSDVAQVFGLDEDGAIATLVEGRDTWSGRTVLWPIEGTSLRAPVDLAALPVYSRERTFLGFRGFGVVRSGEAQADPDAIGLALVAGPMAPKDLAEEMLPQETTPPAGVVDLGEKLLQKLEAAVDPEAESPDPAQREDPFQGEQPALQLTPSAGRRMHDKVISLEEHRAPRAESGLTPTERNAFREIADRLRREGIGTAKSETPAEEQSKETKTEPAESMMAGVPTVAPAGNDLAANESAAKVPDAEPVPDPRRPVRTFAGTETPSQAASDAGMDAVQDNAAPASFEAEAPEPAPANLVASEANEDDEATSAPAQEAGDDDTSIVARLPLPILIHSGDLVHYANQALLDLTGYETTGALIEAGGLEALFAERREGEDGKPGAMVLRRADGGEQAVEAHLQAVPWRSGRALMLSLLPQLNAAPAQEQQPALRELQPISAAAIPDQDRLSLQTRIDELTSILDTATDGVVIIGSDGLIRSMNHSAAALFGYEPEQIEGKSFSMLFAIESQRAAMDYLDGLAENGVASVLNDGREVIGREAQGRFIPMFMTIGKLAASNSYCAVLRDITQWKRAEEELTNARHEAELASSQKSEFLARISHEIRTPLNAIIGFSELMSDEKFGSIGNERYRNYLRDINRSGNHVLALVNDLLDISKIEAGGLDMQFEAVSLNDAISEAVAIMQPQANRERVIIRSSFPSNLPDIVADARSVKQIALNLLSNAVRFTSPGGQVIVSTLYEADGGVVMRVRDTGVGMTQAEIEQALKPFKQINTLKRNRADDHTDWRQDGTGLGLPLTKAMVEANRAVFSIESTPGNGTMVEISFPSTRVLAD